MVFDFDTLRRDPCEHTGVQIRFYVDDFMTRNIKRAIINTESVKVEINHLAVMLRNRARLRELPIAVPTSKGRVFLERTDLPEAPIIENE